MRYQIKLVPDNRPNADGRWVDVPVVPPHGMKFAMYSDLYRKQIPEGFHMVAIQKID
jgi:uncharacterized protein YeaO (DUF488 family)